MSNQIIDLKKPVKIKYPQIGEENIIYKVANFNEVTQRCYIEPINLNMPIAGQELVSINDIENI